MLSFASGKSSSRNNIKLSQLSVLSDTLIIGFQQAKHHFGSHISISIPRSQNAYCPVAALSLFTASLQNAYCPMAALSLFTASSQNAYSPVAALSLFTTSSQNAYCPVAALSLFTTSSQNAYCPVAALSLFTISSQNAYCPVAALSLFTTSSQNAYCPVAALSLSLPALSLPAHRTPTAQWQRSLCSLPGGAAAKALCSVNRIYPPSPLHSSIPGCLARYLGPLSVNSI